MSFVKRPGTQPRRPQRGRGGTPAWLVFLVSVAFVFAGYYLWTGFRNFLRTGGFGVVESTRRAVVIDTATALRQSTLAEQAGITLMPSSTPIPECLDFVVIVPSAIIRERPSTSAPIAGSLAEGDSVCVIGVEPGGEWYLIDRNPITRRIEAGYMFENIIQAVNPTPTPTRTFTPLPTVTPVPSATPTATPPSQSPSPAAETETAAPTTPAPSSTPPIQSA